MRRSLNIGDGESSQGPSEKKDGSIIRIKCETFLTYDKFEVFPGDFLNIIIGPNGTGKSTIMCAICLCLGGRTNTLGRASRPQDFIKNSCSSAKVEIELYNTGGKNYIISRHVRKEGRDHSQFFLNGNQCSQKDIEDLTARLNIHVDNLCQFLPQDRVAEFSKMNPQQLLHNTEEAVGPEGMAEDHKQLKEAAPDMAAVKKKLKELEEQRAKAVEQNEHLEHKVRVFKEREKHISDLKELEVKAAIVDTLDTNTELLQGRELLKKATQGVEAEEKKHAPLQEKVKQAKEKVSALENQLSRARRVAENSVENLEENKRKIIGVHEEAGDLEHQKQRQEEEAKTIKERLEALILQVRVLKNQVDMCEVVNFKPEIDDITKQIGSIQQEVNSADSEKLEVTTSKSGSKREIEVIDRELANLNNVERLRMEQLNTQSRDAYRAAQWVKQNAGMFRMTVHLPIMTVVSVTEPKFHKYMERMIPRRDLVAFVCECKEDVMLLGSELRDKQKLRISVVLANPGGRFDHPRLLCDIQQYGFYKYATDVLEGPPPVLNYLCQQYGLHRIPIGTEETRRKAQQVVDKDLFNNFFTENHQYVCTRSRYGNKDKSTRISELRPATGVFTQGADTTSVLQLNQTKSDEMKKIEEYDRKLASLAEKDRSLRQKQEQLRKEKNVLMNKMREKEVLMSQLKRKESEVTEIEQHLKQMAATGDEEIQRKARKMMDRYLKLLADCSDLHRAVRENAEHKLEFGLELARSGDLFNFFSEELQLQSRHLQELRAEWNNINGNCQSLESKLSAKKRDAEQKMKVKWSKQSIEEELKKLKNWPENLDEITAIRDDKYAKIHSVLDLDENVVEEYEGRKHKICQMTAQLEKLKKDAQNKDLTLKHVVERWQRNLQDMVSKINENYSRFYKYMGGVGEASIIKEAGEEDYGKYGICIKVKNRDAEELSQLTNFQSGGERSVATILYVLALQELKPVPFRCVDEINQGMDAINERRVFDLISRISKQNSSQYFFITPKLLKNLAFEDYMTVHCLHNSPVVLPGNKMNLEEIIKKVKRLKRHNN